MHPIEHLRYVARARGADPASLVRETAQALTSMRFDPSGLVVACRRIVERHPDCGPLWWLCARMLTASDPFEMAWDIADEIAHDPTPVELSRRIPDDSIVVTVGWPDVVGRALARRGDVTVYVVDSHHQGSSFVQRLERHDVPCELVPAEGLAAAIAASDLVLVDALAVSPERLIAPMGSTAAAMVGSRSGVPVWLAAGVGRRLPDDYVGAMIERMAAAVDVPWHAEHDVVPIDQVSHVVGAAGLDVVDPAVGAAALIEPECPMAPELLRPSHM